MWVGLYMVPHFASGHRDNLWVLSVQLQHFQGVWVQPWHPKGNPGRALGSEMLELMPPLAVISFVQSVISDLQA